jgi:hypothetical protein
MLKTFWYETPSNLVDIYERFDVNLLFCLEHGSGTFLQTACLQIPVFRPLMRDVGNKRHRAKAVWDNEYCKASM